MPAQGESRDVCHIIEGWCASHDRAAGHVHEPIEGEIGMDPADRSLASDPAAEEQYAGVLPATDPAWRAANSHQRRAALAVVDRDVDELARLRAESAAVGALRNASQVILVRGFCLQCHTAVIRRIRQDGAYATLSAWEHELPDVNTQHPVTNVLPPA